MNMCVKSPNIRMKMYDSITHTRKHTGSLCLSSDHFESAPGLAFFGLFRVSTIKFQNNQIKLKKNCKHIPSAVECLDK